MMHTKLLLMAIGYLVLAAGCGRSTGVIVRGELQQKGERYRPAEGEQVMISFAEASTGGPLGDVLPTRLAPDGTFTISGPTKAGIRPGTYRVGITSMPEVPVPGKPATDKFGGAFELAKSPLSVDVAPGKGSVTLEIP